MLEIVGVLVAFVVGGIACLTWSYWRWKRDNRHYVLWDDSGKPGGQAGRAMAIVLDCLSNGRTREEARSVLERSDAHIEGFPLLDLALASEMESRIPLSEEEANTCIRLTQDARKAFNNVLIV